MILVYKTDVTLEKEEMVKNILSGFNDIIKVTFDFEDCDNILRIEARTDIALEIESHLVSKGFSCKELM